MDQIVVTVVQSFDEFPTSLSSHQESQSLANIKAYERRVAEMKMDKPAITIKHLGATYLGEIFDSSFNNFKI